MGTRIKANYEKTLKIALVELAEKLWRERGGNRRGNAQTAKN